MSTYIPGVTDFIPDIQPFQPDWSTIDRTMRTKQGRYDQGYSAVQSSYSGLLNMPQLKQSQISKRDQFLKQAFKNIGDLSSVDLSLPENAQAAQNVFAPLYNDAEFLGNAAVSKHYNSQEEYADSLRQKDGGKEFSMDNLNYVRMQKQEYIQDESPDSWKKYYGNKKYYESYYDYSKEYRDAMAQFKPSHTAMTRMNGMYFVNTDDQSWKKQEIKDYLNAALSEKAKRQMQIEGVVRIGSSPEAMIAEYKQVGQNQIQSYKDKLIEIDGAIRETKDPNQKKQLYQLKSQLTDTLEETQTHLNKAAENDYEYVKNNRESIASQIYYDKLVNKVAEGYEHQDIKETITENSVAFGQWKDAQEWGRMNAKFNHDYNMENLKAQHALKLAAVTKKATDEEKNNPQGITQAIPSGPEDVKIGSISEVKASIDSVKAQKYTLSEKLRNHVAQLKGIDPDKAHMLSWNMVRQYMDSKEGQRDQFILTKYRPDMSRLTAEEEGHAASITTAEKYGMQGLTERERIEMSRVKQKVETLPAQTVFIDGKNVVVSPSEIYAHIAGGGKIIRTPARDGSLTFDMTINGKHIHGNASGPLADSRIAALDRMARQVELTVNNPNDKVSHEGMKAFQKYNSKVNEFFNTQATEIREGITFNDDSKPVKATKGYISSILPDGIGSEKVAGIVYDYKDNRVYFGVAGTETRPIDSDRIVSALTAGSNGTRKAGYSKASGKFWVQDSGIPGSDVYKNLTPVERSLLSVAAKTPPVYESDFFHPIGPVDKTGVPTPGFRYEKRPSTDGGSIYYLYVNGEKKALQGKRYEDLPSLLQDARSYALDPVALDAIINK